MKLIFSVIIMGALGAMSRFAISLVVTGFYSTLIVNIIGSFALVIIFDYFSAQNIISETVAGALGTGFIGAFTTFSAFSVQNINLFLTGQYFDGIIFTFSCLFGGLLSASLAMVFCKKLIKRRVNG